MPRFLLPIDTRINSLPRLGGQIQRWRDLWFLNSRSIRVAARSVVIASTLVTGILASIQHLGYLETLELLVLDRLVQRQADAPPDPRLLIVTITEADLNRYRWPLSDQILAQALRQLQSHQPRVIGLDLYRDISIPPGASALATQLQTNNLVVITEIVGGIPAPATVPRDRVGFNDFTLDVDGVLRRNLLFVAASTQNHYSFALRLSLSYLRDQGVFFRYTPEALFLGQTPLVPLKPTAGGYQTADTRGYQILLQYRTRTAVAQTVTLSQVLDGQMKAEWARDRLIIIGTTAPSLKDQVYTPYSASQQDSFRMSGVMIHAQMVSHLLDIATEQKYPFQFYPYWGELLWLWSWAVIGSSLVWCLRHPVAFSFAGASCLLLMGSISWVLFSHQTWIPVAEPMLGLLAAMGIAMAHRLFYTTNRDLLTGLLNRGAFVRYLGRSLKPLSHDTPPRTLGVMVLTLDRFHLIRKRWGDPGGELLLLEVLQRWQAILPKSAQLARIGNDEFAIAIQTTAKETVTTLADQLQSCLVEPFAIQQQPVVMTTSIGIAVTQPDCLHQPDNLLRDAHTAMYRAKALGTAKHEVFASGMLTEAINCFVLENDLRQAILAQEFVLYYQPIVCFQTDRIVGFEALVRWQHPSQGFISPLRFIPLAEETGLIIPLGQWICQTACWQAHHWQEQFPDYPLTLSINLSSRQLEQPDLIDQLARLIQTTNITADVLKLEITESMVMKDIEGAIDLILRLKSVGFRLSMDDFGTGYSSLSQIRRLPIDTLKVDKSFVEKMGQSPEDYEITRMIITLAHTLGMDVVAEGVETQADAEQLRSLGCEFGQGYFWAKPLPAAEATTLLQRQEHPVT